MEIFLEELQRLCLQTDYFSIFSLGNSLIARNTKGSLEGRFFSSRKIWQAKMRSMMKQMKAVLKFLYNCYS